MHWVGEHEFDTQAANPVHCSLEQHSPPLFHAPEQHVPFPVCSQTAPHSVNPSIQVVVEHAYPMQSNLFGQSAALQHLPPTRH